MRILAICASPRGNQSLTLRLVRAVAKGAVEAGADVDVVDLCKLSIKYCTACGVCYAKGHCVHHDDFASLYARILDSDGLIIGSPNYLRSITAQLKTMFDRMADAIHCQLLTGKYACAVGTAGGPGHNEVTDYLTELLVTFGAYSVGSVGAAAMAPGALEAAENDAIALGNSLVAAMQTKRTYPDQDATHAQMRGLFKQLVLMHKDEWHHEVEYWQQKGEL